jgi:hypothetical protein
MFQALLAARRRAVIVFDDTNTVLRDCLATVALARHAGIPMAHMGWFVFDQSLPESEEVPSPLPHCHIRLMSLSYLTFGKTHPFVQSTS